jgi:hypothetical protein
MEFNLTAKDKHALKSLSRDLRDMFSMKKVEDRLENPPEYTKVFDATFFKTVDGNYLDEMLNWIEDFNKRLAGGIIFVRYRVRFQSGWCTFYIWKIWPIRN